jgi:hypothetical protein
LKRPAEVQDRHSAAWGGASGWSIAIKSLSHAFTVACKLGDFLLLRLTASASTIDVAGERIGTPEYSDGKARGGRRQMLSIVLMPVVLLGFNCSTNCEASDQDTFREELLPFIGACESAGDSNGTELVGTAAEEPLLRQLIGPALGIPIPRRGH